MAEPEQDDQDGLKKKLVRRIALAGVAAVVLLGGLALFENYLSPEPPAPAAPAPTAAAPAAQPAEAPKPEIKPAEEEKKEAVAKPEEPKAEPEKTEMPLAPPPEPRPASRVVIKPPAPASAPAAPAKKAAPTKVERIEPAAPAPAVKVDPATIIARSYRLQMGVFTAASNAEELHAKLEKAGIPSYVESRVHVGPFKTQKEADEARRKLKELGLGPGRLIPPQKR